MMEFPVPTHCPLEACVSSDWVIDGVYAEIQRRYNTVVDCQD